MPQTEQEIKMADGDYERGRSREISALAARLKQFAAARAAAPRPAQPPVLVLNGWAASPQAWDLCRFMHAPNPPRLFSYIDQLDGAPAQACAEADRFILVGWSMGGSSALRLAARWPEKVAGLILIAATPRMMEEKETGWRGMSPRRLEALRYGLVLTRGGGFFGTPPDKPNPYLVDTPERLQRGLTYLLETDLRQTLEAAFKDRPAPFPVFIFQSERDGIVRPENAAYLKTIFPQAAVTYVPGTEHALMLEIQEKIDDALDACLSVAPKS
jgi:pimeloyl-ACP methyl ester carboxylesterase